MEARIARRIIENKTLIDSLLLIGLMSVAIVIVNPIGDFPLNDDWSFAKTVKRVVELGIYVPTGWTVMTLFTNVAWGALFCIPFGSSFNVLRASTLIMSVVGVFAIYFGSKELGAPRLFRFIAALTLAFNPIYFALSHTFMTDIAFSSLLIISALFFLRYLKRKTLINLVVGTLVALAATMSRQVGLAVPLAFFLVYIVRSGVNIKVIFTAVFPLLICAGVLTLYQHWLSSSGRTTALYGAQSSLMLNVLKDPRTLLRFELRGGYESLIYLGLFLLPALLFFIPYVLQKSVLQKPAIWLAIILVAGSTYFVNRYLGFDFPIATPGNVLGRYGIGPLTLRDTYFLGAAVPELPHRLWFALTALALVGATLIVFIFIQFVTKIVAELISQKLSSESANSCFLWFIALIYLPIVFTGEVFDRYLLPVLPILLLIVLRAAPENKKPADFLFRIAGIALVIAFFVFSIGSTRDYLTWNRVRWQALNDLTEIQKVNPEDIDGGFEFNGFLLYDRNYHPQRSKSWWWVERDTYVISFNPIPGYTVLKEYPYSHWLPRYEGKILVSKKAF